MKSRFSCAASALILASALSAPAFAQGTDSAAINAAASTMVVGNPAPSGNDAITDFDLALGKAPAAPTLAVGGGTGEVAVSSAVMAAAAAAAQSGTTCLLYTSDAADE